MRCEYVEYIDDVHKIMDKFGHLKGRLPLSGAIYIGCYGEEIESLCIVHDRFVHFYVRDDKRGNAMKYAKETVKLIPAGPLFAMIPEEHEDTIKFAEQFGMERSMVTDEGVLMGMAHG